MKAVKPKGVTILRHRRTGHVVCQIKGRGRTGAQVRSMLARATEDRRQSILSAWWNGRLAEMSA